jgi:hypothetical protein
MDPFYGGGGGFAPLSFGSFGRNGLVVSELALPLGVSWPEPAVSSPTITSIPSCTEGPLTSVLTPSLSPTWTDTG